MTMRRAEAARIQRRRLAARRGRVVTVLLATVFATACDKSTAPFAPPPAAANPAASAAPVAEAKPTAKPAAPIAAGFASALQKRSTFPSELGIPGTNDGVVIPLIERSKEPTPFEPAIYDGPTWPPAEVTE